MIKEDNPFPSICGRVCIAKCEDACNRGKFDAPVAIRDLKRFVADWVWDEAIDGRPQTSKDPAPKLGVSGESPHRVAIIGSGPAGMTCASDLARQGYSVTVLEALPVAGGMMRVGVPNFRLPHDRVQREIDDILALGVDLKLNSRVNDVEKLFAEGYEAVFLASGSHKGRKLPIPGADHPDVLVSLDFLRETSLAQEKTADGKDLSEATGLSAFQNLQSRIFNRKGTSSGRRRRRDRRGDGRPAHGRQERRHGVS